MTPFTPCAATFPKPAAPAMATDTDARVVSSISVERDELGAVRDTVTVEDREIVRNLDERSRRPGLVVQITDLVGAREFGAHLRLGLFVHLSSWPLTMIAHQGGTVPIAGDRPITLGFAVPASASTRAAAVGRRVATVSSALARTIFIETVGIAATDGHPHRGPAVRPLPQRRGGSA